MDFETIKSKIDTALSKLYQEEYLFKNDLGERVLQFRFAHHLVGEFEAERYVIDCEYNRFEGAPKSLMNISELVIKRRGSGSLKEHEEEHGIHVSPDIIVHRRGSDRDANLLILELKKPNSPLPEVEFDMAKISAYKTELGYKYGALITFDWPDHRIDYL